MSFIFSNVTCGQLKEPTSTFERSTGSCSPVWSSLFTVSSHISWLRWVDVMINGLIVVAGSERHP